MCYYYRNTSCLGTVSFLYEVEGHGDVLIVAGVGMGHILLASLRTSCLRTVSSLCEVEEVTGGLCYYYRNTSCLRTVSSMYEVERQGVY